MTSRKKGWVLTLLFFFLCSISGMNPFTYQQNSVKAAISETVHETLREESFAAVIVYLKDKADLADNLHPANKGKSPTAAVVEKLQQTASASVKEIWPIIEQEINRGNIKAYQPFWIVNAFAAKINAQALKTLSALPQVANIRLERQYKLSAPLESPVEEGGPETPPAPSTGQGTAGQYSWNLEQIKAPLVWEKGIYGKDVVVAIMDTGVDLNHPALKEKYRGNLPGHCHETSWYDATTNSTPASGPLDLNGHGTHIAGIILGGTPQEPLGVAPGAYWMAVNIFNNGYAWDSHITQAFQWLLAPGGDPQNAPQIVNCSWASRPEYVTDHLQWEILHNLEQAGIFVVFAAGNNGTAGPGSPASYPHAFSVGALQKEGETCKVTDFSSRGPVSWQGATYTKPEITAPGTKIRSAWLHNGYNVLDGTSLAAAHVSGAAALLLEARPGATPLEIRYILQQSAYWDPAWDGSPPDNTYGYGILDAYQAVKEDALPDRELIFIDGAEEGVINWSTSAENPWKLTREMTHEGFFAFTDSPYESYKNNAHSWLALAKPLLLHGYHSAVLSFCHYYNLQTGKDKEDDYAYVEISVDGKNWAHLYRFSGTNETYRPISLPLILPSGAKSFYLRFRLQSNNSGPGQGWYIDDITVSAIPLPLTSLESLQLTPEKTKLGLEDTISIKADALFGSAAREIEANLLEWSSSNPAVAVVREGKVQGIAPGKTVITGKFSGHTATVNLEVIAVQAPVAVPEPGVFLNAVKLELHPSTPGATVYYSLDGSEPDEGSLRYEKPLQITESTLLKAREYVYGIPGPVKTFNYTIKEGAVVTGTIKLQGRTYLDSKTSVSFICNEEGHVFSVPSLSPQGRFSIKLPLGSYKMVVNRQQYLQQALKVHLLVKETTREVNLTLRAGDLNNDKRIDITDLTLLSLSYESTPADECWNPLADLNGDGIVDIFDLTLLTQNYRAAYSSQ